LKEVETLKNRIKQIRKEHKLTQVEFGKKIGVKGNTITNYETGYRNPTDAIILSICKEFKINEEWLRNGTEPMYAERDGSFTKLLSDLDDSDDDFIKSLIRVYMGLDKNSKEALKKIADGMIKEYSNVKHKR